MTLVPRTDGQEIKYLLPEEIITDPIYNVRPGDVEDEDIEELAQSIENNGQEDTAIVSAKTTVTGPDTDDYTETYTLIAGHRRRRAISLINTKRSALGEPLLKLRVYVDRTITTAAIGLRKAITNNLHRKGYTPLQIALLIERIKKDNAWDVLGFKGTKFVAEYLGVNPATITQHEKFLKAPDEIKQGLASGELSAQGALMLLTDVKPEKRQEVIETARKVQAEVEKSKPKKGKGIEIVSQSGVEAEELDLIPEKKSKGKATRVEEPSLRKAIRQTEDATEVPISLSRKEIIAHFQDLSDAPAYGYPDGDVRQWAKAMVEFCAGTLTERKLLNKFDKMVVGAGEGTEKSVKVEPEPKAAPARATRKDAGKAKPTKEEKSAKPAKPAKAAKAAKEVTPTPKPSKAPKVASSATKGVKPAA